MVENLNFDAIRESGFGFGGQFGDGSGGGPEKDTGVAGGFLVTPFDDEFEVFVFLGGADDADRLAGALENAVFPTPGVRGTVDGSEIGGSEVAEAGLAVVDHRTNGLFCADKDGGENEND